MTITEITPEELERFRALMGKYHAGGGPFIMINLNDLWQEYDGDGYHEPSHPTDNAAGLIKSAVELEIRNSFKDRIHEVAAAVATDFVKGELNEAIRAQLTDIFKNGYTRIEKGPNGEDIEVREASVPEQVKNLIDKFLDVNSNPHKMPRRGSGYETVSLRKYIDEEVNKHLAEQTKTIIKDVNAEVLAAAKKSISSTVSDQLFSGLNLLPKIGGANQR